MSRTPMEPTYLPNEFYPSREAETFSELLAILSKSHSSVTSALASTAPSADGGGEDGDESERLDQVLTAVGNLRTELDTYTRVVAEWAMRDHTLLETAKKVNTGKSTLSRWRIHPVALDGKFRRNLPDSGSVE